MRLLNISAILLDPNLIFYKLYSQHQLGDEGIKCAEIWFVMHTGLPYAFSLLALDYLSGLSRRPDR